VWRLLERIAELERRVAAIYDASAARASHLPHVAAFWREMAADERMHAVVITAARELFAPTPPGEWTRELAAVEELVRSLNVSMSGGVARNSGVIRALSAALGCEIQRPQEPDTVGALGAALIARDRWLRREAAGSHRRER
jgi:hypothetical protein